MWFDYSNLVFKYCFWVNGSYLVTLLLGELSIIGWTLWQMCKFVGLVLPCFCYHHQLNVTGNCSMCLIELQYAPKLVMSCGVAGVNYMSLITDSSRVREVSESILELLLLNHPLDCPVCDQGSECDLQDMVMLFSSDSSRFYNFGKKIIMDGYMGPFVRTKMSSCIHCTRCVSYMFYLMGVMDFFVLGRGIAMSMSNYLVKILESEMSGNVIDLCPVGFFSGKRPSWLRSVFTRKTHLKKRVIQLVKRFSRKVKRSVKRFIKRHRMGAMTRSRLRNGMIDRSADVVLYSLIIYLITYFSYSALVYFGHWPAICVAIRVFFATIRAFFGF